MQRSGSVPGTCGNAGRFAKYEVVAMLRRLVYREYDTDFVGKCTGRSQGILRSESVR